MDSLMLGDCLERMSEIPDGIVDCVITSPPYAKQRCYGGASSSSYIGFIAPIVTAILPKLTEKGSLVINIKEHVHNGARDLYVYRMILHFVEVLGLTLVDEYVWVKTNPFPTGSRKRFKDGWERVLHFSKGAHEFYPEQCLVKSESKWLESEKRRRRTGAHNVTNGSGMNMSKRVANDFVRPSNVLTGSSSNINIGHPAVYPIYLPEFFIKALTKTEGTVLDPFMGSGTTGLACLNTGRNFIGIEKDETYFEIAKMRIAAQQAVSLV